MKNFSNFINERGPAPKHDYKLYDIVSREAHVNMISCMIKELQKYKDNDLLEGAKQFLSDYLNELGQDQLKDIAEHFKLQNPDKINPEEILNYVLSELKK